VTHRRFDLIVFDWDGTLMDSTAKIVRCFQAAARDCNVVPPSEAAIRHIIGLALKEAMDLLLPDAEEPTRARVVERYREHFLDPQSAEDELFPGVEQGLRRLSQAGYLLAVATGKARRGLDRVLRSTAIAGHFCITRCADEAYSKPHPKMLFDILDYTGVDASRAVMVGDTTYDLEMAKTAGITSIAVSYGAHAGEPLRALAPLACYASFEEVCRHFEPQDFICPSAALVDGGDGVRFTVPESGRHIPAFAVRFEGAVHAYLNRCSHKSVELDWVPGRFFDGERRYLVCATHGAHYAPATGACAGGPCNGGLVKLEVIEKNDGVYLATAVTGNQ
jgi:phosphoglycolate phosphatase